MPAPVPRPDDQSDFRRTDGAHCVAGGRIVGISTHIEAAIVVGDGRERILQHGADHVRFAPCGYENGEATGHFRRIECRRIGTGVYAVNINPPPGRA